MPRVSIPTNTVTLRRDALTQMTVPVYAVAHLTDLTNGKPLALGKSMWFSEGEAVEYARAQSEIHPAPQRFAAYDPNWRWLGTYQTGKLMPAFQVVA